MATLGKLVRRTVTTEVYEDEPVEREVEDLGLDGYEGDEDAEGDEPQRRPTATRKAASRRGR